MGDIKEVDGQVEVKCPLQNDDSQQAPVAKPSKPTPTRKFTLTAAGIAACLAAMPGVITAVRGEPVAEDTWATLKAQVDKQSDVINKISIKMAYFQAREEYKSAAQLQEQLDDLQKKYNELKPKKSAATSAPATTKDECKDGLVKGADDKCHRVKKVVAKKIEEAASETEKLKKKLVEERSRRKTVEQKKRSLLFSITAQKPLKALPARPLSK